MTPELKRAIIKSIPSYFTLSSDEQEKYRVAIPDDDDFKIKQFLLKALFDITVNDGETLDQVWQDLSIEQCNVVNSHMLPLQGIGEDYFYLNEYLGDDKSILSFPTLYDYDYNDYLFQEESRAEEDKRYKKKPYRGTLYFTWARLLIDGTFTYGILSMVAGYIYSQIDEFGNDYIEELIPYSFKKGKDHGKKEGAGYRWNMVRDACGLEAQLEELFHRFWGHLTETYDRLLDEYEKKAEHYVIIIDSSRYGDREYQFLFSDKEALQQISFKNFMKDCRAIEQKDHALLNRKIEIEKEGMKSFLDTQHKDIAINFNPNILQLRKKHKVRVHEDSGLGDFF